MQNNQQSDQEEQQQIINLPEAGLTSGYGDSFQTNQTNGGASYSIPITVTEARAETPSLKLSYTSGAGNSLVGVGFSLSFLSISRRTDKGE